MTMFMVGCQIIVLDENFSELLPVPVHVPDSIEDISAMISFLDMFGFHALVELFIISYSFIVKQVIFYLSDILLW